MPLPAYLRVNNRCVPDTLLRDLRTSLLTNSHFANLIGRVHIISRKKLLEAASRKTPVSAKSLHIWYRIAKRASEESGVGFAR